ncbi:MAG: NADPH:quinone reductase [Rhizobiaceae bacterium]
MRAVSVHQFGGPEELVLEELPNPVAKAGEVLVDIKAVGVNPIDTYIRSGIHAIRPQLPYIAGGDAAGVVLSTGEGVTGFAAGDRVYVSAIAGGHFDGLTAEMAAVPASEVFHLPDNVNFAEGAALGVPCATAFYALHVRGEAQSGQTVFIHGASGSVGTAVVQMARSQGMTVIGSVGTDEGRRLVSEQGADHVLNHTTAGYLDELASLTGGRGPDLIIEMLANVNLAADMDAVAKFGRIVIVGNRGEITINPRTAMMKNLDIVGLALNNASKDEMTTVHAGLKAGLESGDLKPVIRCEMDMTDAAKSHEMVLEPGALGKIVIVP